jgi:hypothetical protein
MLVLLPGSNLVLLFALFGFFLCRLPLAAALPAELPLCGLWPGQGLGRLG